MHFRKVQHRAILSRAYTPFSGGHAHTVHDLLVVVVSHLECQWLWSGKEMDFTCHRCDFGGNWGQIIMHRNGDRKRHRALLLLVLPSQQWHLPEHQKPYHQQRQIHDIVGEKRGIMVMKVNKFCLLLCRSYIFICTCKEWPWWVVPLLLLLLFSCSH